MIIICPGHQQCKEKVADVVFLLDSSFSIWESDFAKQLQFLQDLVDPFTIGPNNIRVGVATFSTEVRLDVTLNEYKEKQELKDAIGQIEYMQGGTRTDQAIRFAHSTMFTVCFSSFLLLILTCLSKFLPNSALSVFILNYVSRSLCFPLDMSLSLSLSVHLFRTLSHSLTLCLSPYTHIHTHTHTHTHARTHVHARTNIHTHAQTHTHARARAHTHTYTHARIYTRKHTHAHAHAHTHTHTHTYTHTHIRTHTQSLSLTSLCSLHSQPKAADPGQPTSPSSSPTATPTTPT